MSCKLPGAASSPGDHAAASRSRRNDPRIVSREFLFILAAKSRPRGQRERQKAIVTPGNLRADPAYCRIASNGTVATDCIWILSRYPEGLSENQREKGSRIAGKISAARIEHARGRYRILSMPRVWNIISPKINEASRRPLPQEFNAQSPFTCFPPPTIRSQPACLSASSGIR